LRALLSSGKSILLTVYTPSHPKVTATTIQSSSETFVIYCTQSEYSCLHRVLDGITIQRYKGTLLSIRHKFINNICLRTRRDAFRSVIAIYANPSRINQISSARRWQHWRFRATTAGVQSHQGSRCVSLNYTALQWRTQEFFRGGVKLLIFIGGGSRNSVEDRWQRKRGSGGNSPLVRGSTQVANE
jgi:hypothetical protein